MKVRGIQFKEVHRGPGMCRVLRAPGLELRTCGTYWVLWSRGGSVTGRSPDECLRRAAERYRAALGALAQ